MNNRNRPTFRINNYKVRSAGILPYYDDEKKERYVLLIYEKNEWTNIGGKTDSSDKNSKQTAIREAREETDNKIALNENDLNHYIIPKNIHVSKHLLFPVKMTSMINIPDTENIKYKWLNLTELLNGTNNLVFNPRVPRNVLHKLSLSNFRESIKEKMSGESITAINNIQNFLKQNKINRQTIFNSNRVH